VPPNDKFNPVETRCIASLHRVFVSRFCIAFPRRIFPRHYLKLKPAVSENAQVKTRCTASLHRVFVSRLYTAFLYRVFVSRLCAGCVREHYLKLRSAVSENAPVEMRCIASLPRVFVSRFCIAFLHRVFMSQTKTQTRINH
jgi:hypothetical protein